MPLGDSYATLPQLKAYMRGSIEDDVTMYDSVLTDALASVSREIETHCNRQFNSADSASARSYGADEIFTLRDGATVRHWLAVDDFYDAASLVVQSAGVTWSPSAFSLYPRNGVVSGQTGWPFYEICASGLTFDPADTSITAKWGWTAAPAPVKQACLILAAETFQLKDAPFGVAGMDQFGVIRVRDNRMAASKLAPYVRDPILVR
ncbi:head-tail connector protein [Streptomyces sp. NBC_00687]|uniref:head-tail connector protein n=1 Tax=Streptomyces sp. NBC_00687 TaxID=2975807 RepID=UPI00224E39B8|nr:head-tail connector protein [Streptomyces sp. NBC_00687]MCX4912809.1 phage gp6-like head-tail connector protein [Streptomyces sp. NBC_00687]